MMEAQIEDRVRLALELDPRIPNPVDVAIHAAADAVTLRGTVASFRQRRAAVQAAHSVGGVNHVVDELTVRLIADDRSDDQLRGAVLQSLLWDVDVPNDGVDVEVTAGWVTLKGKVRHQFQSDAAFEDAARLRGVGGITNRIRVDTA